MEKALDSEVLEKAIIQKFGHAPEALAQAIENLATLKSTLRKEPPNDLLRKGAY